nr:NADH dehydrogenase subunit 6 [Agrypninae sp. GTI-132]
MITTLYFVTLSMTITFMLVSHPLSMGFILLIQTALIAMMTGLMANNFWFSYILFMIMVGGMLVLFIYMTSVASNEKFMFSNKLFMVITSMMMMILVSTLLIDQFMNYQNSLNTDMSLFQEKMLFTMSMSKYLNFPLNSWMITLIIYLLVALIAVVKITNITYGPLRQKM